MYGKPAFGALNTATGISILPATGKNSTLFIVAASLIVTGVVIMIASAVVARMSRTNKAN